MRKICCLILAVLTVFLSAFFVNAEQSENNTIDFSVVGGFSNITDGKISTYSKVSSITLQNTVGAKYVYIIFFDGAAEVTVKTAGREIKNSDKFLHLNLELEEVADTQTEIIFDKAVKISEISLFGSGELPENVHRFTPSAQKADLMLFTTHADDEQLFFAGLLPLYAGEKALTVQVVYFADHNKNAIRRHELLDGLWTVGVTAYPVISSFPDEYSESYTEALENLGKYGITEDDVLAYQTELIRRFKPLVIVGHDLSGEYGHGQHILNAKTLISAVEFAKDETKYTESANMYGTHDTPKLYLHLYNENKIELDIDVPLKSFGGKTAFQVTQQGFKCHKTQQQYWFSDWLYGKNGEITSSTEITKYSPREYGLYRTTVGIDTGNDMFENIKTYSEQLKEETPPENISPPNPDTEIKPAKDFTGYYIFAAIVLAVIILAVLLIMRSKRKQNIH